ncbi:tetratricopeptide repeat protein 4 [Latimeria chalumnae]|uniref:Tetratricopeptide repeat domain 4 n=1 Tax=Latimeria chalumnae TaxID=7897 RepID=H3A5B5_LATCH|nr:PREDICTED: tetratricopeptide repeat protein 4 [Latimeria chalumnae]|eukprot:XP_006005554.1 PREDICTED: tetratricopeptide repeat protein 4 [Latimeria chalumnae]
MMASQSPGGEEDFMDEFMDKFRSEKYKGGFKEETWEQEFENVPMFMKMAPTEINSEKNPELACLQSILFDDERPLEDQARTYKDEGNDYFKEKDYKKAIISYTEGLKKKCNDIELNVILYTNRAAAQFHLGNNRSSLNDVIAARKLKPSHLKAITRGALCHFELKNYKEAVAWCDDGLKIDPKDKKILDLRTKADKLKRAEERDARKAKMKEKKEQSEREALLKAIHERKIQLYVNQRVSSHNSEEEEEDDVPMILSNLSLGEVNSERATGAKVFLDDNGSLNWPVLFLYPEYGQTDFISAFHESARFIDHLMVMFGEELPAWDHEKKYYLSNLELYFEDEHREQIYQTNPECTLLKVLQHKRYFVKAGTPKFIILAKGSSFCKEFLLNKNVHWIK